jgi:cell wall-associated NlpC family hydrolase
MTPDEFAQRCTAMDGPRYVRWRADWQCADCYGILVLYWRHVVGIELRPHPGTSSGMADGFAALGEHWRELSGPQPGACGFMAWDGGLPRHCGVVLPGGELLHTEAESPGRSGGPRSTRLAAMRRLYPDLRFYAPTAGAVAP